MVVIAIPATTGGLAAGLTLHRLVKLRNYVPGYWQAARALEEKGVKRGDKLAIAGDETGAPSEGAYLARLTRTRIVAQVPRPDSLWAAPPSTQCQVIDALARTGAKAILTVEEPPRDASRSRWQPLANTRYYLYLLKDENAMK